MNLTKVTPIRSKPDLSLLAKQRLRSSIVIAFVSKISSTLGATCARIREYFSFYPLCESTLDDTLDISSSLPPWQVIGSLPRASFVEGKSSRTEHGLSQPRRVDAFFSPLYSYFHPFLEVRYRLIKGSTTVQQAAMFTICWRLLISGS